MDQPSATPGGAATASQVEAAIQVEGAYKRFGRGPWVLKNLNMTVPKNGIYGLLGSSGCGKTTLLTAITGFSSLDFGSIRTSISSPSRLGFMPQEVALFGEFTIAETFIFFARLYNISPAECALLTKELTDVLDLPPDDQLCSTLSGGQARRVSIAVTMLHSPDIIILDEPTSGVDPLLAHCFWQYLTRLTQQGGRTIIITTHYIEEARQADTVALMRHGVLLAESPPEDLIRHYKVTTLEDVFLQLCYVQKKAEENPFAVKNPARIPFKHPYKEKRLDFSSVWSHTMAIFFKIISWVRSNLSMFLTVSVVVVVLCVVFCNEMLSNFPPTSVGFVNEESGGDCDYTPLGHLGCGERRVYRNLGCKFVDTWRTRNPGLPMINYQDFSTAMGEGRRGKISAVLRIPGNFSRGVSARMSNGSSVSTALINSANIEVWADNSDYMRSTKVEYELQASFIDMYRDLLVTCGYDSRVADMPPMQISTNIFLGNAVEVDMFDYTGYVNMNVIAGISCLCALNILIPLLSVDKMCGNYARCHLAGVRTGEIFLAHTLFLTVYNLVIMAIILYVYYTFYRIPRGSIWLTYFILNLGGAASIVLGLFMVTVTQGVTDASSLLTVYIMAMSFFTGYTWPIEALWPPIKPLSYILFPNTIISIAYRAIEWKGATLHHPEVMNAILYTIVYVAVLLIAICFLVRRKPSFTAL